MVDPIVLRGKVIVAGRCEGPALVTRQPVSFLGMVNTELGTFDYPGHELQGQSMAGKVLICSFGKGSSGDAIRMWRLQKFGVAPLAILFDRADPIHAQGAMLLNVPSLYQFDRPICDLVHTGDRVLIDGPKVTVFPTAQT